MGGTCLRRARIRCDIVAMLLFQRLWLQLPVDIVIFMYVDSSPQVRGEELCAASFEHYDYYGRVKLQRRLMPMIGLPRDMTGQIGKSLALIWIIWLLVGQDPIQVTRFCNAVRAIDTNMGVERKLANMCDMLPEFHQPFL